MHQRQAWFGGHASLCLEAAATSAWLLIAVDACAPMAVKPAWGAPLLLAAADDWPPTAVVAGMNDPTVEIKRAATKAMEDAIEFIEKNFENEQERNVIMQAVLTNTAVEDDPSSQAGGY